MSQFSGEISGGNLLLPSVHQALLRYEMIAKALPCTPETATAEGFCNTYGYPIEEATKTLVFATDTNPVQHVACLALATSGRVVTQKVTKEARTHLGLTRRPTLSFEENVEPLTGMEIGGITPPGMSEDWPLYIDQNVMDQRQIIMGGGNLFSKIVLNPEQLFKLPNVHVIEGLTRFQ